MAYRKNAVSFNAEVDRQVNESFKKQWKKGQVKNDATTAALRLWTALPHYIQSEIINKPPKNIMKYLTDSLLESEVLAFLRSLSPEDRQKMLETAKKARL